MKLLRETIDNHQYEETERLYTFSEVVDYCVISVGLSFILLFAIFLFTGGHF